MSTESRVQFASGREESSLRAVKGIVLYESQGGGEAFATVHGIEVNEAGRATFLPGRAMTNDTLGELVAKLIPKSSYDYLPPELLGLGKNWMVWWCPAGPRTLFFKTSSDDPIGVSTVRVNLPPLVFAVRGQQLFVYALKKNERPIPGTDLWMAPFYNLWDSGKLCRGNARLPKNLAPDAIPKWESMFFDSVFTHPNPVTRKLTLHRNGLTGLWHDIVKERWSRFPLNMLAPSDMTLAKLVKATKTHQS